MKKILISIFIMSTIVLSAQNTDAGVKNHLFKANLLLTPSLEYERKVTNNTTLGIQLGTEILFATNSETDTSEFAGLFLEVDAYYRYYYNFKRRTRKGKNTLNNSANYFGITTSYIFTEPIIKGDLGFSDSYIFFVGPVYGFQRTYWKGLNLGVELGVELGVGYSFSDIQEQLSPIENVTLGWVFGR